MRLIGDPKATLIERVFSRCQKEDSGCWIWTGATAGKGYGHVRRGAKMVYVHRLALEEKLGRDLLEGFGALHHCDTPRCCNPDHLWEGTNQQNIKDRMDKDRSLTGSRNHMSKLSDEAVREARRLKRKVSQKDLAERFGVTKNTISRAVRGASWGHVS